MSKPDAERDKVIAARYAAGESPVKIAVDLGIVRRAVYNAIERTGTPKRRKMNSLTPEQEDEVVHRFQAGENVLSISRDFKPDVQTLHNVLVRRGVKVIAESGPGIRTPDDKRARVIAACTTGGKTLQGAANANGISKETAFHIMREHREAGGEPMPRGRRPWCSLNHAAFDTLTPDCLYWLGFLFADGCAFDDAARSPGIICGLAEKDRTHLERLRVFAGSSHAIVRLVSKTSLGGPCVYWRVRSKHIHTTVTAYGIVKKRTRTPPDALARSRDFWRGAVDGDGWLGTMPGIYPYVGLSGQEPLLRAFQTFLTANGLARLEIGTVTSGACFRVGTSGRPAGDIIRTLYQGANIALTRKQARAESILSGNLVRFPPYIEEPSAIQIEDDLIAHMPDETSEPEDEPPKDHETLP